MSDINLGINAGESKRLLVGGKYCPDNIVVTASGVSGGIDTSDATAVAGDLLLGKTAYANGQKLTGTIANKGWLRGTITPQSDHVISGSAGYYDGINVGVATTSITLKPLKGENLHTTSLYEFFDSVTVEGIPDKYQDITNVTAGAPHVLEGRVFADYSGDVTGTMPNIGAVNEIVGAGNTYVIPEGYHNGLGKVVAEAAFGCFSAFNYGTFESNENFGRPFLHNLGVAPDIAVIYRITPLAENTEYSQPLNQITLRKPYYLANGENSIATSVTYINENKEIESYIYDTPDTFFNAQYFIFVPGGFNSDPNVSATYVWFCGKFKDEYIPQ